MVSESVVVINAIGWRGMYGLIAVYGLFTGCLILIFVKEPMRGRFEIKKVEEEPEELEESDEVQLDLIGESMDRP